jgi:hypothetical protein
MCFVSSMAAAIGGIFLHSHVRTLQTCHTSFVSLVAVSHLLQCGCLTCSSWGSWQYEMYTDVPLCHMTQTLIYIYICVYIYMAAVCCWWLCSSLQCGCVTGCSWQYEMYTDVRLCHMTQTLIYMAAVCYRWLRSIFNNCASTVDLMQYWDKPWNMYRAVISGHDLSVLSLVQADRKRKMLISNA